MPFLALSFGHFVVDALNGLTPVMIVAFSVPLGLGNAMVGLLSSLYGLAGAVFQPLFGLASDRHGGAWASVGGLLWMGVFFTLACVTPVELGVIFMLLAGIGPAAFHPAGTMDAADLSRRSLAGKAAAGTALFFLFGQIGSALGPAAGGALLDLAGSPGLLAVVALCAPAALLGVAFRNREGSPALSRGSERPGRLPLASLLSLELALILTVAVLRFWVQASTQTFVPKLMLDRGFSATTYGALAGVFMAGAAAGGVIGGFLADRYGNHPVILGTTALSVVPLYLFPLASGPALAVLIAVTGVLNVAPHSILVTMAQNALPGRSGLASGLIMGSMFTLGGVGILVTGLVADRIGLMQVLQANVFVCVLALGVGIWLWAVQRRRHLPGPA